MKRVLDTAKRISRNILIYISVPLLMFGPPSFVYADGETSSSDTSASSTQSPTSPDATSQTDNSTTTPAPDITYTYNPTTNHWDTNQWQYDPATKSYVAAPNLSSATNDTVVPSTSSNSPTIAPDNGTPSATSAGPSSSNSSSDATTATNTAGSQAVSSITNALNANATSGDANVTSNTKAGDATSGNASSTATVLNNVNSIITNQSNQNVANFTTNIMGDVNGDFLLQPVLLKALLEAGAQNSNSSATVQNTTNETNDINLAATSGNATVSKNTQAGSATTGSANTVADVVNIINSLVAANQSFVGNVNIYGNLDGDILVAPGFVPQLITDNQDSKKQIVSTTSTAAADINDTQSIVNNIKLAAQSGQAIVNHNTSAGNATSGNASTNVVIFNLTGHHIIASDSILVFVNVLGTWVGAIVDAPTGATAALVGSGVNENNQDTTASPSMVVHINNDSTITNNINLVSQSGDAIVTDNTSAGNATSGNATASANILNMSDSQISLTGWFGILFINVFGSWIGSFGIDTSAGNNPASINNPASPVLGNENQPINFIPHGVNFRRGPITQTIVSPGQTTSRSIMSYGVAFAPSATAGLASAPTVLGSSTDSTDSSSPNLPLMIGSIMLLGASLFGLYRFRH